MLKNSRISDYKLKKILHYFVEDSTATETAQKTKLNRNTINRYYKIFRKIVKLLLTKLILTQDNPVEYIGYAKGIYGDKKFIDLYKYSDKLFLFTLLDEEPVHGKLASEYKNSEKGLAFVYDRLSKFNGFSSESYHNQLIEISIRFYYTKQELFDLIHSHLKKIIKKD